MEDFVVPEWQRSALLVIDVQNDFVDGAFPVAGTTQILPALSQLVQAFRDAGQPVVHVIRYYVPGGDDVDLPRRAAVRAGSRIAAPGDPGSDIPPSITGGSVALAATSLLAGEFQEVGPHEVVMFKPRWSAFYRTSLESWLRERDVSTVVVAGCNLPNCPRAALFAASERDFRTVLAVDAVSQVTEQRVADFELIGVQLWQSDDIRRELAGFAHGGKP